MTVQMIRTIVLGAVAMAAPVALMAQVDPSSGMPSSAQPSATSGSRGSSANPALPQDSSSGLGGAAQTMKDKIFIRKAAEGGMAEVQYGQLALQKSSNDAVKEFAQKMIDDHTRLNENMKPVADTLGVPAPKKLNKEDQEEYDKLSALSGPDFDKEYLTAMVKDHRKDLREFREEETEASDPALKDEVSKGETVISEHMRMVYQLAKANGVVFPHGGKPSGN